MADGVGVEEGKVAVGSLTNSAGDPSLARGAAGSETGARTEAAGDKHGDLEDRRETEQVLRPTTDGVGEGLVKDQS